MKLNKLPVLIRTEVTAAAKSASLPAVYSRALIALEEAVSELSFDKLKQVEISAEGLAAWAKAHQDEKLTKTARELKFRTRRTAFYIAEQLSNQRRATFVRGPGGRPPGPFTVLKEAGYAKGESSIICAAGRLPDTNKTAILSNANLRTKARGLGDKRRHQSEVYETVFGRDYKGKRSPLGWVKWFRENSARGVARKLNDPTEITKAKQTVTLIYAWCEEFLKNLPRTVSKAKV
jgi:hypothetical protein